jgi:hypothetical protein
LGEQKEGIAELEELNQQSAKLAETYRTFFYKVDPALDGTDPEKSRRHILETTGTVPSIYDKGTHYVSHHRLNLVILKKLNDIDYVLEVMGDYTGSGASIGPQHDIGDWKKIKDKANNK